ncbi:MAG: hypothetical protein WDM88_13245 [Galbitalea sp.]
MAAARSIALANLGEFAAAREAAKDAMREARSVGYPAGIAFGLQAAAVAEGLAGDSDAALQARLALREFIEELGTYSHLRVAPAWVVGDMDEFVGAAAQMSWLEGGQLQDRLASYLDNGAVR